MKTTKHPLAKLSKLSHKNNHGFVLLEYLIGAAITGAVMVSLLNVQIQTIESNAGKATGERMLEFKQAAAAYFLANRSAMVDAMNLGTNTSTYCRIGPVGGTTTTTTAYTASLRTCALDTAHLQANNYWPTSYNLDAEGNNRFTAIFRTTAPGAASVEMLAVVSKGSAGSIQSVQVDAQMTRKLGAAMSAIGAAGGFVPAGQMGRCASTKSGTVQACGGDWSVDLSNFLDPTIISGATSPFRAALPY